MNKHQKKKIFSLALDITDKCNSKCNICGIWKIISPQSLDPDMFREQLSNSKFLRKIRLFNIGGGEPFMEPDNLKEIIKNIHQKAKPIQIRIATNGLLTNQIISTCKEIILEYKISIGLKISFDGFGEVYSQIRGIPNGDKIVQSTIEKLIELKNQSKLIRQNLEISLGFTATKINLHQIKDVFEYALSKNIGFFYKPVISGGLFKNENILPESFLLDLKAEKEQLLEFNKIILNYIKKQRKIKEWVVYSGFFDYYNSILSEKRKKVKCGALNGSAYITPNGDVFSCLVNPISIGNIYQTSFDEIWEGNQAEKFRKEKKKSNCWCLTPCDTIPSLIVHKFPFYF